MNAFGLALVWLALQVSLLSIVVSGVYLLVRRRNPRGGASVALSGLLLAGLLTLAAVSPWPKWSLERSVRSEGGAASMTARSDSSPSSPPVSEASPSSNVADGSILDLSGWLSMATVADAWSQLDGSAVSSVSEESVSETWHWSGWVGVVFVCGVAVALARLCLSLLTVRQQRRSSRCLSDAVLLSELDVLCAALSCRRPIELRESDALSSAATIGWRKPLILLPPEWRSWTPEELRSVLAHEMAHIQHQDFFYWLCAQAGLLVHFYHPLLHWLAGRLRLEQELAADALAAKHAGGVQPYLRTLAELALRQADRPLAWPARTFLPTKGTLMRRVEMLRDSGFGRLSPSHWRRALAVLSLCLTAFLLAGIRQPEAQRVLAQDVDPNSRKQIEKKAATATLQQQQAELNKQQADQAIANQKKEQRQTPQEALLSFLTGTGTSNQATPAKVDGANEKTAFDLTLVPPSTTMLIGIRPAQFVQSLKLQPLAQQFNEMLQKEQGLRIEDIDQVLILGFVGHRDGGAVGSQPVFIVTMNKPTQFGEIITKVLRQAGKEATLSGQSIRQSGSQTAWIASERTVVFGQANAVKLLIDSKGGKSPAWSSLFETAKNNALVYLIDMNAARPAIEQDFSRPGIGPLGAAFSPFWKDTKWFLATVSVTSEKAPLVTTLVTESNNTDEAVRIEQTAQAAIPLLRNMLAGIPDPKLPPGAPPEMVQLMAGWRKTANDFIDSLKVSRDAERSRVTVSSELNANAFGGIPALTALLLPAIQQTRVAAQRTAGMNNLKQIGLAFHNYHDAYGQFPGSAVMGPDGKTPHSWRVAILPFIDQAQLYDEYKRNEPWDSENNRKVLAKMPPVFRHPSVAEGATTSSYYVFTGPDTAAGPVDGPGNKIQTFTDGTSNTILAVEAKRDIPWTKPEDIPFEKDKPVPQIGGFAPDGSTILISDGSVRFLSMNVAMDLLKALITRNGGEAIPIP